jgi:hypothetical protein
VQGLSVHLSRPLVAQFPEQLLLAVQGELQSGRPPQLAAPAPAHPAGVPPSSLSATLSAPFDPLNAVLGFVDEISTAWSGGRAPDAETDALLLMEVRGAHPGGEG